MSTHGHEAHQDITDFPDANLSSVFRSLFGELGGDRSHVGILASRDDECVSIPCDNRCARETNIIIVQQIKRFSGKWGSKAHGFLDGHHFSCKRGLCDCDRLGRDENTITRKDITA
jgi:hypothetical protein